jgi:hypothetical protein
LSFRAQLAQAFFECVVAFVAVGGLGAGRVCPDVAFVPAWEPCELDAVDRNAAATAGEASPNVPIAKARVASRNSFFMAAILGVRRLAVVDLGQNRVSRAAEVPW